MKTKTRTATFLYILFVAVFIGTRIVSMPGIVANMLAGMAGILAFGYSLLKKGLCRSNSYLIIYGVLFTMLMLLSILYNGNADFTELLWIWAYTGIAVLLYEFKIPQKAFWLTAYAFIAIICLHIFRGGTPRDFLALGSENNISVYVIFLILVAYLGQMTEQTELKYLPAFLCLAISLWTGNRGGLLATVVLIVCAFIYNFLAVKKKKLATLVKLGALFAAAVVAINGFFGEYIEAFINKMDRYGNTSVRTELWTEYANGVFDSIGNFFFGVNTTDPKYPYLYSLDGHPHNTFLMLHAKFGLFGCILLIILICKVLIKALKEKNGVIVIVLVAASTRMIFDWMGFTGIYDVLFWYMLLYILDPGNTRGRTELTNEK